MAGGFDYLLKTRMADMDAYREFAGSVLWQLPGVRDPDLCGHGGSENSTHLRLCSGASRPRSQSTGRPLPTIVHPEMTMRTPIRTPLAATLLLFAAVGAGAPTPSTRPVEVRQSMQSGSGQMEQAMAEMNKQMAAMTPEQRKMMQDAMGKQGMSMPQAAGQPMTMKMCVTPEMAARNEVAPSTATAEHDVAPAAATA